MKSATTMRGVITMSMIILILSAGFIIYSYDRDGSNVKILNEDDYEDDGFKHLDGVYPIVSNNEFQGPVPEGYDLDHFKKTGETIKEGVN